VGVVRGGHPLMLAETVTAARYAAWRHVATPQEARITPTIDAELARQGLQRDVAAVVPGFPAALAVACASDLVALLPASFMGTLHGERAGYHAFELPVAVEGFSIALMWHPRAEADPAHRWLRELVVGACRERMPL
jgi:DNA-binding transcriptional LysR family regulator